MADGEVVAGECAAQRQRGCGHEVVRVGAARCRDALFVPVGVVDRLDDIEMLAHFLALALQIENEGCGDGTAVATLGSVKGQ